MNAIRAWYGGISDRERDLLTVLSALFALVALLLIPYSVHSSLSSHRDHNEALHKAIRVVQASRGRNVEVNERREQVERRYRNKAPALAGFIENAARKNNLEIPESKDGPEIPHGKDKEFIERSTMVQLRRVSLLPLVTMLETIENAGHPIAVTRLRITRQTREPDMYDVQLGVSAFDRAEKKETKPSPSEGTP